MLPDPLGALPAWLLTGMAVGGLLAVGAAGVFIVGVRLFLDGAVGARGPEGGERRRRAEVRRYLAAVGEPFVEDHDVGGRPAAFYLPRRRVAITFDARNYFRFERAGVRAVLLEYELPGSGLGGRLPFEPPGEPDDGAGDADRFRGAAETRASAAFAALGLPAGAPAEAVRAAYRERVKDAHPDHGGDVESFRRLREAYAAARERAE